uniref:Uncharacterized protein n=1 Tax=Rhizophora mucronata TaxID=61149 RepID=A0A2P2QPB0_RHIMU
MMMMMMLKSDCRQTSAY